MSSSKSISDLASKLSFYTPPDNAPAAPTASSSWFGGGSLSTVQQQDEESAGFMSWASAKISNSVNDISATKERLTMFGIFAAAGVVCMIFAFTFLPFLIISPHKFSLLFTMGSALMLVSFSFLRGHVEFVKHLSSIERLPFSGSYIVSLVGTLYSSLVMGSYLLTMIFSVIQIIALLYFLVSYIPGGVSALTFVGSMMGSGLRRAVT